MIEAKNTPLLLPAHTKPQIKPMEFEQNKMNLLVALEMLLLFPTSFMKSWRNHGNVVAQFFLQLGRNGETLPLHPAKSVSPR